MYQNIRNLREDKDLTQQQMADYLNITQATYSRYESGNLDIPSAILIKLSKFHNVSTDYLLGQTNVKKPYGNKQIALKNDVRSLYQEVLSIRL